MILTRSVQVTIINKNINHYVSLGYDVWYKDLIDVPVEHLTKGSHVRIDVQCGCGLISNIKYQDYLKRDTHGYYACKKCAKKKNSVTYLMKYGVDNPSKSEVIKKKKIETTLKNYGVENPFQSEEIKDRIKEYNMSKYGVEHYNNSINYKEMVINRWEENNIEELIKYRNKVSSLTRLVKENLICQWDGYDYYDGEYIKDNYSLSSNDPKYPTIDHKTSIYHGFYNGLSIDEISNIDNLCITKRSNNSQKSSMTEEEYKEKYNYEKNI